MDRSPTTAAARLAVILAALTSVVAGCAGPAASSDAGHPTAYASPAGQGTALPAPPGDDDGPGDASTTPPSTAAQAVATAFAHAWARPDLPPSLWLAGIAPFSAPTYLAALGTVDPANVPAHTVTGPATAVTATPTVSVYAVPTDAGTILITCTLLADRWLVTDVTRPPT